MSRMALTCLRPIRAVIAALILAPGVGCAGDPARQPSSAGSEDGTDHGRTAHAVTGRGQSAEREWFTDGAPAAELDFAHFNGMSGRFYMPEIMGPGVGFLDYDNDGDLDVYFVQARMLEPGKTLQNALIAPHGPLPPTGRLFRNDLSVAGDGSRRLRFTDVTDRSGISAPGYGMGVATGDIDNDGWIDLYLTNFGRSQMFRNKGDGTFVDISRRSGTDGAGWAVSAAFLDYDRDGWLDLYVGNYLNYTIDADKECFSATGGRDYCAPQVYRAQPDRLYRNKGDGTFDDVTSAALVGAQFGPALGVVTADFDGDGWIDIYVANDSEPNQLWINQGNGAFADAALLAGAAFTGEGKAEASMGVDAGDFDNDGDEDLFMTELSGEGSNLYVNDGSASFTDLSAPSMLGPSTVRSTGFGTGWLDFDNDGWLDLLSVNGMVRAVEERLSAPFPYDQRKHLLKNLRNRQFEEVSAEAGAVFQLSEVGRGAAFGDIDNDGDTDVLVANAGGPARLLINEIGSRNHWVGLRLVGQHTTRDMLGARVAVVRGDGATLWRRIRTDGSYASANDPRVLVGLGDSAEVPTVRVRWPNGREEEWSDVAVNRWTTLKEGGGR
ncbi:MAG: hypothetical protein GEU82_09880 [Luteitalea sp.]|nr:hypothetical protein [Luteitalea sp.]